jgi:tRNA G18 (ribose-2'-O)-methylase SpoU
MNQIKHNRGYFGIGIQNAKNEINIGTLWRTARIFGAAFIFTIGSRYKKQSSDTLSSHRHIPLYNYATFDDFYNSLPYDCQLVGVELDENSTPISDFRHPERCVYLLGAEDTGLTKEALEMCHNTVVLHGEVSLNVAVAGSIVLFDRLIKQVKN